ncbi:MAG: YncE family protein [Candidatus Eiseniibacteriota bacterium]
MRSNRLHAVAPYAVAALLAGCSTSDTITGPSELGDNTAIVVTSDFSTGGLSVIDVATRQVATNVASVHSDATLRVYGGLIYVVNRFGQDNIQVIDPVSGYTTRRQFSTGNGSNPQDIAFASPAKAYVSRYGSADLLIVDPRTGAERGTISLAAFADADGLPEMARMALVEPWLFIACQRLTNFAPANPSLVVDTRIDQVADTQPLVPGKQPITLTGRNPFTDFVYDPASRELLIGCAGAFGAADGGIERIDSEIPRSLGYAATESALGGDVLDLVWHRADHSYAIVADASFNNLLVAWSTTTGAVTDTIYAPGGYVLPDCEINSRGELYVADNGITAPGVRIYRAGADTLLAGPLGTGLPPSQIAFR